MKKPPVVMSALAAALAFGATEASASTNPSAEHVSTPLTPPAISAEARSIILQSASQIAEDASDSPIRVARKDFTKGGPNGPIFRQHEPGFRLINPGFNKTTTPTTGGPRR